MFHFVVILIDYNSIFYHFTDMVWFPTPGYDATTQFLFEVHIVVHVCGLPLCFKYSQDDRHSIYLDVYCFELLGMGNAWAGIHIRKRTIWTSSSGENTRMTWLTHTQTLNGSSLSKWWAWDTRIQVKPRNGTFLCLWTSSIRKHGVSFSPSNIHTHTLRYFVFKTFSSLSSFCTLSGV